jgi:hypothetical protein
VRLRNFDHDNLKISVNLKLGSAAVNAAEGLGADSIFQSYAFTTMNARVRVTVFRRALTSDRATTIP